MKIRFPLLTLFALTLCTAALPACGDPDGPAGEVDGASFEALATGGYTVTLPANSKVNETATPVTLAYLNFSTAEGGAPSCAANEAKANSSILRIVVMSNGETVAPGTYSVLGHKEKGAGGRSQVGFGKLDKDCRAKGEHETATGAVTITSVTETSIAGELDLTFPSETEDNVTYAGGRIKGAFTISTCAKPVSEIRKLDRPACKP
jgi:hypothetical protein